MEVSTQVKVRRGLTAAACNKDFNLGLNQRGNIGCQVEICRLQSNTQDMLVECSEERSDAINLSARFASASNGLFFEKHLTLLLKDCLSILAIRAPVAVE